MIAPTVDGPNKPQTEPQPGYLGYLMQAAIDFGNEIGADPDQVCATMVEVLLSPVDSWE